MSVIRIGPAVGATATLGVTAGAGAWPLLSLAAFILLLFAIRSILVRIAPAPERGN
ncbi:Putative membrane protein [Amycolatopsis japonica]|uniref:Putative membrane protein n=1 Tax=Amycolatopsis japonica TaxID=208439 RepID=A0A075V3V3_9PSEU|nr:Putative membrane protein [Amycolatopsis japonica]